MKLHPWNGKESKSSNVHMASLFWAVGIGRVEVGQDQPLRGFPPPRPRNGSAPGAGLLRGRRLCRGVLVHPGQQRSPRSPSVPCAATATFVPRAAGQAREGHGTVFLERKVG